MFLNTGRAFARYPLLPLRMPMNTYCYIYGLSKKLNYLFSPGSLVNLIMFSKVIIFFKIIDSGVECGDQT